LESQLINIGSHRIQLTEVDSTNTYAQELVSKSNPQEGTAITALYQTLGRGQIGRYWYSSKEKNAMSSVILYPSFLLAKDQFYLSIAVSCAVRKSLANILPSKDVSIKWPNDLYVGDKKVAGLLLQNTLIGNNIGHSIIGIGINVNEEKYPTELPNPTSIFLETRKLTGLEHIYTSIWQELDKYYLQLRLGRKEQLMSEYISYLYGRDMVKQYKREDGTLIHGLIQHVDNQGKLVMLINGEVEKFAFREIRLVVD